MYSHTYIHTHTHMEGGNERVRKGETNPYTLTERGSMIRVFIKRYCQSKVIILNAVFFVFVVKMDAMFIYLYIYLFSFTFSDYIKMFSYILVRFRNLNEWKHKSKYRSYF